MRNVVQPVVLLLCSVTWPVFAQETDPIAVFASATAISDDAREEGIKSYLLKRVPSFPVGKWEAQAKALRQNYRDNLVLRGVPETWRSHEVRVEWTGDIETAHGYRIRKLRYEALPSLWIPALLYEPDSVEGKIPAVLNVNGHVGAPGKAIEYEQIRCINLAKRGMLALHPEWFGCGELISPDYEHGNLAYLDLVGVSGLAVFHYALERALDVLLADPRTDAERVAMTGLSGGGWQTAVFSAIDERIRVIVPNAGYSGFALRVQGLRNMGDLEQAPADLLTIADFSHITALFAPRPTLLIYNVRDDCCFTAGEALPTVYEPVKPIYEAYGRPNDFQFHINNDPGTHNYDRDNRVQFYNFIERYFLPPDQRNLEEIPSDDEVLSFDELAVGLPKDNATFQSLALAHASSTRMSDHDSSEDAVASLRDVTRFSTISPGVRVERETNADGFHATALSFDTDYGPFYGLLIETGSSANDAAIHVSDTPLSESLPELRALAESHGCVLAIEPIFLGGNQPGNTSAWQYAMALEASGQRTLGVQAAQIAAGCEWLRQARPGADLKLYASGPKSGLASLVAAALADGAVRRVSLRNGLENLLKPVQDKLDWRQHQSLFCFGLQAATSISEIERILDDAGIAIVPF